MSASLPLDDLLLGTTVAGRYRIVRVLREGGMGRVYVAEHTAIRKLVAFKVLRQELSARGEMVTRFQQEAISASRIKHPNVLEIFDFGQLEGGSFFLVMELLEGRDLADELRRVRTLDVLTGMRIAFQICSALAAAHARGVVHRDMKPDNVFLQKVDAGVAVKIVDFGIAQLRDDSDRASPGSERPGITKAGTILGTPEYMAPEQGAGRRADHRADVYAVGVILYEMFTGRVPFRERTSVETLAKHQTALPPPMSPALSQELRAVILRALAKNPGHRFQRMRELERALAATPEGIAASQKAAPGEPVKAVDGAPPDRTRRSALAALASGAALIVAAFVVKATNVPSRANVAALAVSGARAGSAAPSASFARAPMPPRASSEFPAVADPAERAAQKPGAVTAPAVRLCDVDVDGVWHGPCGERRTPRSK